MKLLRTIWDKLLLFCWCLEYDPLAEERYRDSEIEQEFGAFERWRRS